MVNVEDALKSNFSFTIDTGAYKQHVFFIYGEYKKNNEVWNKTVENTKEEYKKQMIKGLKSAKKVAPFQGVYVSKFPIRIIWVQPKDNLSGFMSTLTHEVGHAVADIMRHVGIPLTESAEEAYTYLTGYMIENIIYNMFEYEYEEDQEDNDNNKIETNGINEQIN